MTRTVLSIDPGYAKRGEGCANILSVGGVIRAAFFQRPGDRLVVHPDVIAATRWGNVLPALDHVVWEAPQFDGRTMDKDPRVILELGIVGASLANLYAGHYGSTVTRLTPTQWKGSIEKPPHHHRLWGTLTAAEQEVLGGAATAAAIEAACEKGAACRWRKGVEWYPRGFLTHNLLDAAALVKRFEADFSVALASTQGSIPCPASPKPSRKPSPSRSTLPAKS